MNKGLGAIIVACICLGLSLVAVSAEDKEPALLYDGYALNGAQGVLMGPKEAGQWFFRMGEDITDGKSTLAAGAELRLLPSSGLQRLIADANESGISGYKLWGRVTKYRGRNFIFPMQYLAAGTTVTAEPNTPAREETPAAAAPDDANDKIGLPVEVLEKLRSRRVIRTEQLKKPLDIRQDSILANRTGFITGEEGHAFFTLDALGRNISNISFELLPCEAIETAQEAEAGEVERVVLAAAGVVTQYQGRYYLLLQRANRVYGHGNFAR